eukprot:TRINITY_DN782270_c0_g1_i1.p1 TRINITY_DN782270_c0_g1~~TRINITY_DN782270_c0_g1_i1.p1  ORF type:complete len:343 (-),score=86.62 TRINITY_DN782270_c0_g1_i1:75-1103(-)
MFRSERNRNDEDKAQTLPPFVWKIACGLVGTVICHSIVKAYFSKFFLFFTVIVGCIYGINFWIKMNSKRVPLNGGWAVVTGASSGIGKEISKELVRKGYNLVVVARNMDRLQALAELLVKGAPDVKVIPVQFNLASSETAGEELFTAIESLSMREHDMHINILVNNAGVGLTKNVIESDLSDVNNLMSLNMRSLTKLCRLFGARMTQRGKGHILNISSMAGCFPNPHATIYGASKAFVTSFSKGLNYELYGSGVSVTVCQPGPTHTEFASHSSSESSLIFRIPGLVSDAKDVAHDAVEGMLKGEMVVTPGLLNRFTAVIVKIVPDFLLMALVKWMWAPTESK